MSPVTQADWELAESVLYEHFPQVARLSAAAYRPYFDALCKTIAAARLEGATAMQEAIVAQNAGACSSVTKSDQGRNWRKFNEAWSRGVNDYRAAVRALSPASVLSDREGGSDGAGQ